MELLEFVARMRIALCQCGRVALALQGRVQAEQKMPDSPHQQSTGVSVVDRVCQEILLVAAAPMASELVAYSEEMAACPGELLALFRGTGPYELVLDPLDGTDDYLAGRSTYAHVLGLLNLRAGRFDVGMLHFPFDGVLFWGLRGMGAFVSRGCQGAMERLPKPQRSDIVPNVKRMREADYRALAGMDLSVEDRGVASVAWVIRRLLEGDAGLAVFRQFHGHDTGPGSVLLEELGGAAVGEDGQPVRYVPAMPRDALVVASGCASVSQAAVAALGESEESDR